MTLAPNLERVSHLYFIMLFSREKGIGGEGIVISKIRNNRSFVKNRRKETVEDTNREKK